MRIVLLAVALALTAADEEPTYKGKPASYWLERLRERDAAVRKQAVEGLGAIGSRSDKAAPALLKALDDDNDEVREAALGALGQLGPAARDAIPAVVAALKDRDPMYRKTAMQTLGQIGGAAPNVVPALVQILREDKDLNLRRAAIRTLGDLGPAAKPAVPVLEELLGKNTAEGSTIAEALGRIGPEGVPALARATAGTHITMQAALKALTRLGPASVTRLTAQLQDPDLDRRQAAARTLERLGAVVLAPAAMHDRWRAAFGPIRSEYQREVPLLKRTALDAAFRAALPVLIRALADKDALVRVHAAEALVLFEADSRDAAEALLGLLADKNASGPATNALVAIGPDAVPALLKAAQQRDSPLASRARLVLIRVRPIAPEAVPVLVELLRSEERTPLGTTVGSGAASALASSGPEVLPAVLAALKGKDRSVHAYRVIELLGPKAKDAVPVLIELLRDSDPFFRIGAVRALGQIGPAAKEAVFPLLKLAESDQSVAVRSAAAEAVKKIR